MNEQTNEVEELEQAAPTETPSQPVGDDGLTEQDRTGVVEDTAPTEEPAAAAPTPEPAKTTGLDEVAIARILKAAGVGAPAQQQAAEPQMTQEEFNQRFNVFNPTVDLIEAIRAGGEPAVAAMAQLVQGAVKQAVTMGSYQAQLLEQRLQQRYAPIETFHQEQQRAQLKAEFIKLHPELADYEVLGDQVVNEFKAQGRKFANKEEAFVAVKNGVHEILKKIGVTPVAKQQNGTAANGATQPTKPAPRMPTLSGGGQGAGNTTKPKPVGNVSDGLGAW